MDRLIKTESLSKSLRSEWFKAAFATKQEVSLSPDRVRECVERVYGEIGYNPPVKVIIAKSPFEAVIHLAVESCQCLDFTQPQNIVATAEQDGADCTRLQNAINFNCGRKQLMPYESKIKQLFDGYEQFARELRRDTERATDALFSALMRFRGAIFEGRAERSDMEDIITPEIISQCQQFQNYAEIRIDYIKALLTRTLSSLIAGCSLTSPLLMLSVFKKVLNEPQADNPLTAWEYLVHGSSLIFTHRKFCILAPRPEVCRVDSECRLHCDSGPALEWQDGCKLFLYHGVRVPAYVIMSPGMITAHKIAEESNVEIRRVLLEMFGEARFLAEAFGRRIHRDEWGTLYRSQRARNDGQFNYIVKVVNSTPERDGCYKDYFLHVADPKKYYPDYPRTARAAIASTFRDHDTGELIFKTPDDYDPHQMS